MAPGILDTPAPSSTTFCKHATATPSSSTTSPVFDPSVHLSYNPPSRIHTLNDLSLPPSPISQIGSTDPFPLLSPAAITAHRQELFSAPVLRNCMYHTRPGSVQLRGMAPRYTPFIHSFWTSPEVLAIVSKLAGIDLIPVMDHEVCHTNVQLGPDGVDGVWKTPVNPPEATPEALASCRAETESKALAKATSGGPVQQAIVPWHRDSHPFVCVVMLSDARHMTSGETELRKGDGTTIKVRSPQIGGAVVMQGRHISHLAIPAGNMPERITIVTSFRPRSVLLLDSSTNMNIRTKSNLNELYYQWTTYRLKFLGERFRAEAQRLEERYERMVDHDDCGRSGDVKRRVVDVEGMNGWVDEQIRYLKQTLWEMRPVEEGDGMPKDELVEVPI